MSTSGLDPIEFLIAFMTFVSLVVGGTVWIVGRQAAQSEKQATDIGSLRLEMDTKVNALEKTMGAALDSLGAEEAKYRHDLANTTQSAVSTLQVQLNHLRDNGATKSELSAVESRLTTAISEVKVQVAKMSDKLDVIPEINSELRNLNRMLKELSGTMPQGRAMQPAQAAQAPA